MSSYGAFLKLVGDVENVCGHCTLEDHHFCAGLSAEGLRGMNSIRGHYTMSEGDTVFGEGEQADHLFALVEGHVKLSKLLSDGRKQIVGFLFPGDIFGFSPTGVYGYTAEALTPLNLCRFSESRMTKLMRSSPEVEHRLLECLAAELRVAQEQMLLLGRMTAREKVVYFLLMLSRRAEYRGAAASTLDVPMSRQDMADYLGLTIETVSRTISNLKRDGLIRLSEATVMELLDVERMAQIVEGGGA